MKGSTRELGALFAGALALVLVAIAACNTGMGDCPAKATIQPGAACSDDNLQCPIDLASPSPACDGTSTTFTTSCTCTKGLWVCPSAVDCDSGEPDEAGSDDGSAPDDDGGAEAGSTDDGSADSGPDGSPTDASDAG